MTTQLVHGVCPHDCPDSCSFITQVQQGQAIKLYATPHHPITDGWLCAKVRPYLEHVYHPDRLHYPLRRIGGKGSGQWQRISWAEALAEIGERWQTIIAQYGAEAILPYSYSGTLGLVQMGAASSRFWNRLAASRLERSICGAAAEYAVNVTLGARYAPAYGEVQESQLVVVWGHNPVSTAPHWMPALRQAQRNGTKLIVIDPRRTKTANSADWHIAPKPATDGALALGLAHLLVRENLHNEAWLQQHTTGWEQFRQRLADYPPEQVAEITGLSPADLLTLARLYATKTPSLIKIADGINRHPNGGQTVRAICALPALTGQYGQKGGGLAYSTSGYVQWDSTALNHWQECPPPGRWVNMNRLGRALLGEVSQPPIMSLFVFGANPAAVNPNAAAVIKGLKRPDLFTVVHELFMTDTADYADIVLPATSQLEHADLHKAYGHTLLSYNAPAISPIGESKSNWELMGLLAKTMGFSESWLHQTADELITEVLTATAQQNPLLETITLERLKQEGFVALPVSEPPFANGIFPTPSGKVELFCQRLAEQGLDPLPGYVPAQDLTAAAGHSYSHPPLNLITPAAHHFTTSTFANQANLLQHEGDPFLEIHPDDAAARGIAHGDWVTVENSRGSCQLRAKLTQTVSPGVIASPKGRWLKRTDGSNVNFTTSDALADFAGQSTFHTNQVWLRPNIAGNGNGYS